MRAYKVQVLEINRNTKRSPAKLLIEVPDEVAEIIIDDLATGALSKLGEINLVIRDRCTELGNERYELVEQLIDDASKRKDKE